ncbi:hypothetical protein O3299_22185 [Janthinobacterium sp. SUN176]|uniref:hypothetical protein n=1 Tax=Janthinobacterium sp. SUN176 TaxID=3014788 RepID=UPI002712C97D|nr:hypothetical protein [Janthinobacterium sp. SUN176]MDO8074252.1 hypothetical protein [Janthinobacterium sp. SUN176]
MFRSRGKAAIVAWRVSVLLALPHLTCAHGREVASRRRPSKPVFNSRLLYAITADVIPCDSHREIRALRYCVIFSDFPDMDFLMVLIFYFSEGRMQGVFLFIFLF